MNITDEQKKELIRNLSESLRFISKIIVRYEIQELDVPENSINIANNICRCLSIFIDKGAYAKCSACGRYSVDPCVIHPNKFVSASTCDCGRRNHWTYNFEKPNYESMWSIYGWA